MMMLLRAQGVRKELVEAIRLRPARAAAAITLIKSVHTLIFIGMGGCVLHIFYSGITGRASRWMKGSLGVVLFESVVYFGNGMRCPLADLAEGLGADHGAVGDIFLPSWFARRIPVVSSTMVAIGLAGLALRRYIPACNKGAHLAT